MMLEIALVGAPNSGKSTFFKAATLKDVKIAPYPFTTLEPNEGLAYAAAPCPCIQLDKRCGKCADGTRLVPVKLWDVAGLVPDAHLGHGRGNAFLDDVMRASGIIHVLDGTGRTNSSGVAEENWDIADTVKMISDEMAFWLANIIKKEKKVIETGSDPVKTLEKRLSGLGISESQINMAMKKCPISKTLIDDKILVPLAREILNISKPCVIATNKADIASGISTIKLRFPDTVSVETSADMELALREAARAGIIRYIPGSSSFTIMDEQRLTPRQKNALSAIASYLSEHGSTGIQAALNRLIFDIMKMIVVYPVENEKKWSDKKGNVLPDAFLVPQGSTVLNMAYMIHEDIGKSFITAIDARTGRPVGAGHVLKDGDIISIRSGK